MLYLQINCQLWRESSGCLSDISFLEEWNRLKLNVSMKVSPMFSERNALGLPCRYTGVKKQLHLSLILAIEKKKNKNLKEQRHKKKISK